ncbi:DUF362 domain-containing protein [Patescibacteria group bacterium]|nr:DUF362 domain-containing protein [Patescibacteria group bacterium]MBU1906645.1 DUF362 domain-containing protein [Patescibacteria group bacterium]
MSRVAITKGDYRKDNVSRALELVSGDVTQKLRSARSIMLKPNLVHDREQLASTHVDAVRAVIEFVRAYSQAPIIVGDASYHGTLAAFRAFGYENLIKEYQNVRLEDFNRGEVVEGFFRINRAGEQVPINKGVAKSVVDSDFKICISPMKVHRNVGVSLSVKNWSIGIWVPQWSIGLRGKYWPRWQQLHAEGSKAHHLTVAAMWCQLQPDLCVVDGFMGMEKDGPSRGTPVEMKVALAGTDGAAVDAVTCRLMGIDPQQIGYLSIVAQKGCGIIDLSQIQLVGETDLDKIAHEFEKPTSWDRILKWNQ